MSGTDHSTPLDRLWNRLEERYGADELGGFNCDCTATDATIEVLEGSSLTRQDLQAYRDGTTSMADLVAMLGVDIDPDAVDDLDDLVLALDRLDPKGVSPEGRSEG